MMAVAPMRSEEENQIQESKPNWYPHRFYLSYRDIKGRINCQLQISLILCSRWRDVAEAGYRQYRLSQQKCYTPAVWSSSNRLFVKT
jgi:hypothetical protein